MTVQRTSAERKFVRGLEQVAAICREVKAFESANAYELRTDREVKTSGQIEYTCFAVERQAPPDHWPLLLGEAIHNLRASLDHAVWAATAPPARSSRTAFPIASDPKKFSEQGDRIAGVPVKVRSLIEEAQPFKTNPGEPEHAWLAILADLSNADKHREITTVAAKVEVPGFGYDGPQSDMRFIDSGEGRDLHDGTKVMAFVVDGPQADQVAVGPFFRYEVRVEGRSLMGSLQIIAHAVWKNVSECEFGEPFPLFTPPLFVLLPDRTVYPAAPFFPAPSRFEAIALDSVTNR